MNFMVDYQKMTTVCQNIEVQIKNEIFKNLQGVYTEVENMGKYWQGANYAKIVKKFNKLREPVMNVILKRICKIPNKINQIANVYKSTMDDSKGAGGTDGKLKLSIANDLRVPDGNAALKFNGAEVEKSRQNIKEKFSTVYTNIAKIKDSIDGIAWER